jgi:CheY-like chemotaxis protein
MSRPKVLLVDDYLDSLEVWALFPNAEGFDVSTAADGPTALRMVESSTPDIVVMDLDLPGMSGIDAAREAGFDAALVKPCAPDALTSQIWDLLSVPKH